MISGKVRVLIVGAGGVSTNHYKGWKNSNLAQICGIVDMSREVALKRKEEWGCDADVFDSLSTAITTTAPSVVDVCVNEHAHAQVGLEALSYGVPVLTEKIMAHSLAAGYSMARAARKEHCWAGVAYNYPYFPTISKLKAIIDSHEAGAVRAMNITCHAYCYHHILSILYHLFGPPDTIDAHHTKREWSNAFAQRFKIDEELLYVPGATFSCRLVFPDNIVCTITASPVLSLGALPFHIIGIFDSSKAIEITGLDWGKDMKGRMFYLPDTKGDMALGDFPDTSCQIAFDGYCADASRRLLSKQGPSFNWEDGWNIMLLEHAMILSDKRHMTVNFRDLKASKEAELEQ